MYVQLSQTTTALAGPAHARANAVIAKIFFMDLLQVVLLF
jgi:hypothetical protein